MTQFDTHFCKWVKKECKADAIAIFIKLVDCIGKGNGDYIVYLCNKLGYPKDMIKCSQLIAKM